MAEWIIAAITFAILYGLAHVLHAVWDAGYWFLVVPLPFLIVGTVYAFSPQNDRDQFKRDLRRWISWR